MPSPTYEGSVSNPYANENVLLLFTVLNEKVGEIMVCLPETQIFKLVETTMVLEYIAGLLVGKDENDGDLDNSNFYYNK